MAIYHYFVSPDWRRPPSRGEDHPVDLFHLTGEDHPLDFVICSWLLFENTWCSNGWCARPGCQLDIGWLCHCTSLWYMLQVMLIVVDVMKLMHKFFCGRWCTWKWLVTTGEVGTVFRVLLWRQLLDWVRSCDRCFQQQNCITCGLTDNDVFYCLW